MARKEMSESTRKTFLTIVNIITIIVGLLIAFTFWMEGFNIKTIKEFLGENGLMLILLAILHINLRNPKK